jgi:hypothetical protein
LAFGNEIFKNQWHDQEYLDKVASGLQEYRDACLQWPLERAAEYCNLPLDSLRSMVQQFATSEAPFIKVGYGLTRNEGGGNAMRAIALLPALIGAWKKQGGGAYTFSGATGIVAGFPGAASYAPVTSIGCTGASPVSIPPSGAAGGLNSRDSELFVSSGKSPLQSGGSYQLGETMRTAAYTQLNGSPNSTFGTAAGTVLSVNIPVDGRSSGCPMKGGRRSRKNRKSKKSKNSKKSKKSKKNRK